jgi:hypothetical protein
MPTDGADFGRRVHCYGIACTAAVKGADCAEAADLAVAGLERDVRRSRGVPSFKELVALLANVTQHPINARKILLDETENLSSTYADSSLTHHIIAATEKIGLTFINNRISLTPQKAAKEILARFLKGRCADERELFVKAIEADSLILTA